MNRPILLLLAASALLCGCSPQWQAQGGEATVLVTGSIPWTVEESVQTTVSVDSQNSEDLAILCGVLSDGSYDIYALTTFLDPLKRFKVGVNVSRYLGSSGYGADGDPSMAWGRMTFRDEGEEGWFSSEDVPCTGYIDEESLRGEFSCTGIMGSTADAAGGELDGPMDFTLNYICGRESDFVDPE